MSRVASAISVIRSFFGSAGAVGGSLLARLTQFGESVRRGTKELLQGFRKNPWFHAVVGRIAGDVASTQWRVYRRQAKERVEAEKHPLIDLMRQPNPMMTGHDFVEVSQICLDSKGEVFIIIERGKNGLPVELYPCPPHWMAEVPTGARPFFRVSYGTLQRAIPPGDVIWIRRPDPENPYGRGVGTGEALADELDTDEFAAKRVKNFFHNGGTPDVLVGLEGASKVDAERVKTQWANDYQGYWNSGRAHFTGGKITVQRLDTSFKDMQLVELRKSQRDTVIQVFGVPPEILGIIENSNRSTIDSADYLYRKGCIKPRLQRWKPAWNRLAAEFKDEVEVDYDDPVPADKAFKKELMSLRPTAFTDNEIRELADFERAEGKDEFPAENPFAAPTGQMTGKLAQQKALPARRKQFGVDDVPNVLERLRPERITAETDPVWKEQVDAWAKSVLGELADATGQDLAGSFDLLNPLIKEHLREQSTERIKGLVDGTTRDALKQQLIDGVEAGESIRELKKRVQDTFEVASAARAENIARTEVLRSSNWATREAQKVSGVVEEREWVSTPDGRTRTSHRELNAQKRGIDEEFEVDGKKALAPGAFGDPAEDCNCRCTTVAVISDDFDDEDDDKRFGLAFVKSGATTIDYEAVWKAFDAALLPWEGEAQKALQRGFRRQESDVLDALEGFEQ